MSDRTDEHFNSRGISVSEILAKHFSKTSIRCSWSASGTLYVEYWSKRGLNEAIERVLREYFYPPIENYDIQQYTDGKAPWRQNA